MSTTVQIADRLHAINQTIAGIKTASRYWPARLDDSLIPMITAVPGRRVFADVAQNRGSARDQSVRVWSIVLFLGSWAVGKPIETMSISAETLIDAVTVAYLSRARLELDGVTALNGVSRARLIEDSGIAPQDDGTMRVIWQLEISHVQVFTPEYST